MCSVMQTRNPFRYRSGDLGCHNQLISMRLHSLSHCKLLMIFIGLIKRNHGANSSATTEEWHHDLLSITPVLKFEKAYPTPSLRGCSITSVFKVKRRYHIPPPTPNCFLAGGRAWPKNNTTPQLPWGETC